MTSNNGFSFSCDNDLRSFYRASYALLSKTEKPSDEILMQLLYSNCVPILTYGCGIKEYPTRQMMDCNTALNNAIRQIVTYHRWESIRSLRDNFGYKSLTDIFTATKTKFITQLMSHHNNIINRLSLCLNVVDL